MDSNTGYDYKLLSEPNDALKCLICLHVAREPKQHGSCGKLFCEKCIEKNGDKSCPHCRMEKPQFFRDNRSKHEISELLIKCLKEEEGCKWEGTIGSLEEHQDKHCEYHLVACPNKCNSMIIKRDLQQHVVQDCPNREYDCEYCGQKRIYANHFQCCPKEEVTCTNMECSMGMKRMKLDYHIINECEHSLMRCKCANIGCDVELKRKDIRSHELDVKEHLSMAISAVVKLGDEAKGKRFVFKMTEFQNKKDNNQIFKTPSFYIIPNGYHMALRVHAGGEGDGKGTDVSVYVLIEKGDHNDTLAWPFVGDVSITLLNQLEDTNHYPMVVSFTPEMNAKVGGKGWGYSNFIPHSELTDDGSDSSTYLKEDTLFFRVSLRTKAHKSWLECTA